MELTPEEKANNSITTGWDSVTLINKIINSNEAGTHTELKDTVVWTNYRHLEIVLSRENVINYIANNNIDLSQWNSAITAGKTYVTGSQWIDAQKI